MFALNEKKEKHHYIMSMIESQQGACAVAVPASHVSTSWRTGSSVSEHSNGGRSSTRTRTHAGEAHEAPGSRLPSPVHCNHFRSEPRGQTYLFLPLSLSHSSSLPLSSTFFVTWPSKTMFQKLNVSHCKFFNVKFTNKLHYSLVKWKVKVIYNE